MIGRESPIGRLFMAATEGVSSGLERIRTFSSGGAESAGIFYLLDDSFRVGDYVESAGAKGTVEQIALRSLKLRHPRGMV